MTTYTKLGNDPPWLKAAFNELVAGVKEITGSGSNKRIEQYLATTTLDKEWINDATAWCAGFGNFCLIEGTKDGPVPLAGTKSAMAKSFKNYGQDAGRRRGAIAVFNRPPNPDSGHVAFLVGWDPAGKWVDVLGGNQSDAVTIERYSTTQLIALRWPNSYPLGSTEQDTYVTEAGINQGSNAPRAPLPQQPRQDGWTWLIPLLVVLALIGSTLAEPVKKLLERIF